MPSDVFILGGKRTAMGQYVGALKDISAIDLGATAARGALEATNVDPQEIDHAIIGNALQTSGDAIYGARHVALKAGVPFDRPALTVNRLCGSGIQAIVSGAQMIQLGEARTALVGGIESMSQAPHVIRGARSGFALSCRMCSRNDVMLTGRYSGCFSDAATTYCRYAVAKFGPGGAL